MAPRKKEDSTEDFVNSHELTTEQKSIIERVTTQDTDWFAIGEDSMVDFSMMVNPMDLDPNFPEAARMQREKKYAFRWCERTPQRIDELTRSIFPPLRWAIVNRQTLPEMSKYVDPILGCVCCLDQMLLFKPYAHAEMVRREKGKMAEARTKSPVNRLQVDKVDVQSGAEYKINGKDLVTYEDTRDFDGLVVDE